MLLKQISVFAKNKLKEHNFGELVAVPAIFYRFYRSRFHCTSIHSHLCHSTRSRKVRLYLFGPNDIEPQAAESSTLWFQLEDMVLLIGTLLLFDPVLFPKYEA